MAAAAAGAGAASSILASPFPHRLPFPPTRSPLAAAPKVLTLPAPRRLPCPLASSAPGPPPPPEETDKPDPIKLAFARAAAYKKERDSPAPAPPPTPPPPPPPASQPLASSEGSGSKEAFVQALEYKSGNGARQGAASGDSGLLGGSPDFGQNVLFSQDDTFGEVSNKKRDYEYDEKDFLGLDFFEKKSYKGALPSLAPAVEPLSDDDFPEVEIIIGDTSKFEKSRSSRETQPVDDSESEKSSRPTIGEPNEDDKVEKEPPSTVAEPDEDGDEEIYRPTVRSWGMFPRPQNISKAYGGGRNIRLGGETLSAEEKAAKDKRTRELIAAYRNRQNMVVDAKTKAECNEQGYRTRWRWAARIRSQWEHRGSCAGKSTDGTAAPAADSAMARRREPQRRCIRDLWRVAELSDVNGGARGVVAGEQESPMVAAGRSSGGRGATGMGGGEGNLKKISLMGRGHCSRA